MKIAISRKNAWDRLPGPAKAVAGRALGAVPLPWVLGGRFRRERRLAEEAQWWPADRAAAYQAGRLREILALAGDRTPFYRRVFADAAFDPRALRHPDDVRKLPTIDRETLGAHLAEMCTVAPDSPQVDYVSTGGTSGAPLHFYIGAGRSSTEFAYIVSGWGRAGYRPGDTLAVFRGRVVPEGRDGLRHAYDPLLRHHYYSNFHMTDENLARYVEHVRGIGPCFLHVYPSSAAVLARFLRRTGTRHPSNVRGVLAESEIVYPDQRALVEEAFGCRYFSGYGHTEKLVAAAECETSTDYHVWPTYGLLELLDEAGRPVTTPGERGEIVGTGFINTVVPFVRYRTGDHATYVAGACPACGRQQIVLRDIRGHRVQEMLVAHDGSTVSWTALNMHDDTFEGVVRFQFRQDRPGHATLRLVPAAGFGDENVRRVRARLGQKLGGRVDFDVELVGEIPLSRAGKAVYVDQRIGRSADEGTPDASPAPAARGHA